MITSLFLNSPYLPRFFLLTLALLQHHVLPLLDPVRRAQAIEVDAGRHRLPTIIFFDSRTSLVIGAGPDRHRDTRVDTAPSPSCGPPLLEPG